MFIKLSNIEDKYIENICLISLLLTRRILCFIILIRNIFQNYAVNLKINFPHCEKAFAIYSCCKWHFTAHLGVIVKDQRLVNLVYGFR